MKNIIILTAIIFSVNLQAQKVKWIPSNKANDGCQMATHCPSQTLCYSMEYTPEVSGILTSYTTGFFTSCINGSANILHNQSCVINDNSSEISACEQFDKTLLNCSGNTGQLLITRNKPVILHQVCFEIDVEKKVFLEVDPIMGITVSIDLSDNKFFTSKPILEFNSVSSRSLKNLCNDLPAYNDVGYTEEISLYPNPTTGNLKVMFNDGGDSAELSIISAEHRKLISKEILCNKEYSFNLSHYDAGAYIAQFKGENTTVSKKFIIIK